MEIPQQSFQSVEINVTELWHRNLFMQIIRIEDLERMSRNGTANIEDYLQIPPREIPLVQYQNFKILLTELDILLTNAKIKLKETFFDNAKKELDSAEKIIEAYPRKLLNEKFDEITHTNEYELTPLFFSILKRIRTIREGLIIELNTILYGQNMGKVFNK